MKNQEVSIQAAINNARFSLRMEGMNVDDECVKLCEKLLRNEITFEEYYKTVARLQGLKI